MYRATDSLPSWRAFFYFISMIFFLAWLVKNVFIAVIIETFAEIRVQFQQMWSAKELDAQLDHSQIFERTEHGLKLVTIDENKADGKFAVALQRITRSPYFNMSMLLLVLANAVITATIKHSHKEVKDRKNLEFYRNIEVGIFVVFFRSSKCVNKNDVLFSVLQRSFSQFCSIWKLCSKSMPSASSATLNVQSTSSSLFLRSSQLSAFFHHSTTQSSPTFRCYALFG